MPSVAYDSALLLQHCRPWIHPLFCGLRFAFVTLTNRRVQDDAKWGRLSEALQIVDSFAVIPDARDVRIIDLPNLVIVSPIGYPQELHLSSAAKRHSQRRQVRSTTDNFTNQADFNAYDIRVEDFLRVPTRHPKQMIGVNAA